MLPRFKHNNGLNYISVTAILKFMLILFSELFTQFCIRIKLIANNFLTTYNYFSFKMYMF